MHKVILSIDSFKGTMTSKQACCAGRDAVLSVFPHCTCICVPIADGGEGTLEVFESILGGEYRTISVVAPDFTNIQASYLILPSGTAVIEMAKASGLPLVEDHKNTGEMTSFGTGELILHAIENGCKYVILGLGGSATNDGGVGILSALGVKFLDSSGNPIKPCGFHLEKLHSVDASHMHPIVKECSFTVACDVENTLCGPQGASFVFGPQKGATPEDVVRLDRNLDHFAQVIKRDMGKDILTLVGGGAAGGISAGMSAFLRTELKSGIHLLLETVGFASLIQGADLIITGEGKVDGQSAKGKVVSGIGQYAKEYNVPVIVIAGDIGDDYEDVLEKGICGVFSINHLALPYQEIRHRAPRDLKDTIVNVMRFYRAIKN